MSKARPTLNIVALTFVAGVATAFAADRMPGAPVGGTVIDIPRPIGIGGVFSNDYVAVPRPPGVQRPDGYLSTTDNRLMVKVSGGRYPIGRNDGRYDEKPGFQVELKSFLIDQTPVTNEQFEQFLLRSRYRPQGPWRRGFPPGGEKLPVRFVSWLDARAYAKWAKKRLPSEAEWEVAMGGPLTGVRELAKDRPRQLVPVDQCGSKSRWGVCGTFGVVREWTYDWYYRYQYSLYAKEGGVIKHPRGPADETPFEERFQGKHTVGNERSRRKTARGASWVSLDTQESGLYRRWAHAPDHWFNDVGFRCVADYGE